MSPRNPSSPPPTTTAPSPIKKCVCTRFLSLLSLSPFFFLSHQQLIRHFKVEHPVDVLALRRQHGVQLGCLGDGAGEAVQDEAHPAGGRGDGLADEADHNLVAHQRARVHRFLGFQAERGFGGHRRPQHVARRQVAQAVLLFDEGGLGAFPAAGGA